ncbi:MAG: rhomboid family intramembrane serine protease [Chloroflexota bacterium]
MIPFSDSVRARGFPWVNVTIIMACVLVFFYELTLGPRVDAFAMQWGATPLLVSRYLSHGLGGLGPPMTLVTALFVHAGWLHLGGNLLFLWIFGDNVEDRLGHLRYLLFYLAGGVAANLVQIYATPASPIPLVGASGAIAAVLGAYLVMYPRAWVSVLVPIFFFLLPIQLPVILMLGIWFVSQLTSGLAAITEVSQATGGVAWWAHVGGFVFGMVVTPFLPKPRLSRPPFASSQYAWSANQLSPALGVAVSVVSLAGDFVRLLILVRLALRFFMVDAEGPLGFVVRLVYQWTSPLVGPFGRILPSIQVGPFLLELPSLLALVAFHILFMIAIWALTIAFKGTPRPQVRR